MKKKSYQLKMNRWGLVLFFVTCMSSVTTYAQQLQITDFVVFGGNVLCPAGPGQTPPSSPGCGVFIGSSSQIISGAIGSYSVVNSPNTVTVNGNIHSGGKLSLGNHVTVGGDVTALNSAGFPGTVLQIGSNASLSGNLAAFGNISVGGGTVNGTVTHPTGTTYAGPAPAGGNITAMPLIPALPLLPAVTDFPAAGTANLSTSASIYPGAYNNMNLSGGKTITFLGTGTYVFNSILNSGTFNDIVFDFQGDTEGVIKLYIHNDVDLNKVHVNIINGGSASRIFAETHGTGASNSSDHYAWNIANGSGGNYSTWYGTVWAPFAGIYIGTGTYATGALWSSTQVVLSGNVVLAHSPLTLCLAPPLANAGQDAQILCLDTAITLSGSSATANAQFSWTPGAGGHIVSGVNSATPVVNAAAIYYLTVTDPASGCLSVDSVAVTREQCIFPYYQPPLGGKVYNIIGSELNSLYHNFNGTSDSIGHIYRISADSVLIEVIAIQNMYSALLALLQTPAYGITELIDNGPNSLIITGKFPIANLLKLDSLPDLINYCRPLYPPMVGSGVAYSKGDLAIHADFVRNGYDVHGDGVKVGVLSDSYNTILGNPAHTDIINGDLPGIGNPDNPFPVDVLKEYPYGRRSDEGRAMLQIIHDIAPKSKLAFRTGFISAGDFAQGIKQLYEDSCKVIVDDITFITEAFFKDGIVAQAVDYVSSQGVSYFSAAGNFGKKSYESEFVAAAPIAGISGNAHDFGGGDSKQSISLTPGSYTIVLQWEDSFYSLGQTGTQNDVDIYLTYDNGVTLFGFNRVNTGGDPIEILPFTVNADALTNLMIVNSSGPGGFRFKYVVFRGDLTINEHNTGSSTIVGQANAAGAMAVGAVLYSNTPAFGVNPPTIASFSSRGGTQVNGVLRNKPDFSAPNGVNTTVNMGGVNIDNDAFPNFFGTSAAAPHAAGVAALILNAKSKFSGESVNAEQMRALLQNSSLDMHAAGFDFESGSGLIQADAAIRGFASPTPEITNLVLPDTNVVAGEQAFTVIIEGNFLTENTVALLRGDSLPTTYVSPTELSVEVPVFSGNPPIRVYTDPISSSNSDGGFSDTLYFFSTVKKQITITAENKTKKFGESLPAFTAKILVDSVPLEDTEFSLSDLGLDSLSFNTPATSGSNVGIYYIRPSMDALDPADSVEIGIIELFSFEFVDGLLHIGKLPLTITPRDTTIVYGDKIGDLGFNYVYDDSLVDVGERQFFYELIAETHEEGLSDVLALVNGVTVSTGISTGRPLVNSDLVNLNFMSTGRALVNARTISYGTPLVNGVPEPEIMRVIDVPLQAIFDYIDHPDSTTLLNASPLSNAVALIGGRPLVNGTAVVFGRPLVNGISYTFGRPLVNGTPLVNSSNLSDTTENETVVIVDEDDAEAPEGDVLTEMKSVNLITGLTSGLHSIVPGALLSANFDLTYGLGTLTILPDTLVVTADSTDITYGDTPVFSAKITGYHYDDADSNVVASMPEYSLLDGANQEVALAEITAGTFTIVPGNLQLIPVPNYIVEYRSGILSVGKAELSATADNKSRNFGSANPVFTISYSGFLNNDNPAMITAPSASTTATIASPPGNYPILLSGGSALNYNINKYNGTLSIIAVPLCSINLPNLMPICGLPCNTLSGTASGGNVYAWTVSSSDNSWIITGGQSSLNLTYTAGSGGTTGTFTLTVTNSTTGISSVCTIQLTTRCEEHCGYTPAFYGNTCGNGCNGMSSSTIITSLMGTSLSIGDGSRKINFGTSEASCIQSKLPTGTTLASLPSGTVSCAGATGSSYLSSGKFRNQLLGNTLAMALNLRLDPSLGSVHITAPYVTSYATLSCGSGKALNNSKQTYCIPQAVITCLGANNKVSDLLLLANKALGATYVPGGANPSLSNINAALDALNKTVYKCRILVGFSTSSNGAKFDEIFTEEEVSEADFSVFPNPASGSVNLEFTAMEDARISVSVYRADGSLAAELIEKDVFAGQSNLFILNTSDWIPGVYFARINTGGKILTKKLVILRD